jgi:DnaK suppressor protein
MVERGMPWLIDGTRDVRRLEAMLTPEQTTELRARLEADLSRLADHAHSALDFTMDRDRDRIGRDSMDEATEEETYGTQLRLHDRETFFLGKIREAMVRLEAGEIDECEECSEPIGFKRLLARPVTTLCFECKTAREQVESDDRTDRTH